MLAVAIVGILAVGAATGTVLGTQSGSPQAGPSSDVSQQVAGIPRMPALQQQLDLLADPTGPPELLQDAIHQLVGMNLGSPIVLPTVGNTTVSGET